MSRRSTLVPIAFVAIVAVAASAAWLLLGHRDSSETHGAAARPDVVRFHCPMHPTVTSDQPGSCPICHMDLVPIDRESGADAAHGAHQVSASSESRGKPGRADVVRFHCPMHPTVTSDQPGSCPICHMDLVPIDRESGADAAHGDHQAAASSGPAGLARVRIGPEKRQLIGIKTAPVERRPFRRSIRALGRVVPDETRMRLVHTKYSGYVEVLHASATGVAVRKGEPLLEIFSPELVASQQEYLVALQSRSRTAGSTLRSVASAGDELVASARRRLDLFDLSEEQIREIETTGQVRRTMTVFAPSSGTLLARSVTQGQRVDPEMPLLELGDLTRVWVLASVYEYELPFVREGQEAVTTLPYLPGKQLRGVVTKVYPVLDAASRSVQVRLEFPNPDLALKPDMFAEVLLSSDLGERLSVPVGAVMETGTRSIVFVEKEDGLFEPREVAVGSRMPDAFEIVSGLEAGERVLTSGNFFVDSESKLAAALAAMAAHEPEPAHAH